MTRKISPLYWLAGFWVLLAIGGVLATRANNARDAADPMIVATSEASGQTYQVRALFDGRRFMGFDLEGAQVRFSSCTLPPLGAEEDALETHCLDTTGKRWILGN